MKENPASTYRIKRSKIATILLSIELIAIIFLFAFFLRTLRTNYFDLAINDLSDRIAMRISSGVWKSISLIAQNGSELLSGNISSKMRNALVSPVSISPDELNVENNIQLKLSGSDKYILSIGYLQNSPDQGMILPFAIESTGNSEEGVSGSIRVPGITEYMTGLAGRNVFCRIKKLDNGTVLADTSLLPGDFNQRTGGKDFGLSEITIPGLDLHLSITAQGGSFDIPVMPQVILLLIFLFLSAILFFIHVRIVKPATMAMDLFQEKRSQLGIEFPDEFIRGNLYLDINTLIDAYGRQEKSHGELLEKLKELEFGSLMELKKSHQELLIHHSITKKMLKALSKESVIPIMLEGVKELGYDDYIWGSVSREEMGIDFQVDAIKYGKSRVTIPLMDETFFLTKVSWSGTYHFIEDASKIDCRYDDLILLSEGPAFVIPVMKNRRFKCYQFYKCTMTECAAYMSSDHKCWVRSAVKCDSHMLEPAKNPKENCFNCNLFNVEGVLIVKENKDGKPLRPENIRSIVGLVNESSLALEIADLYEETERMSITDSLTGLYNHREFYKHLKSELDRAKRFDTGLSLLMIDVDNFKIFNDTYGHLAGDMALKMISGAIQRAVRKIDIVSRYGGEEFTVILPETEQTGAIVLAERIKNEVASLDISPVEDERVTLTVSIGICSSRGGEMTPDQIMSRADDAAYLAKKTGKNKICISDRI